MDYIATLNGIITGHGANETEAASAAKEWGGHDECLPATNRLIAIAAENGGDTSYDVTHGLAHTPTELPPCDAAHENLRERLIAMLIADHASVAMTTAGNIRFLNRVWIGVGSDNWQSFAREFLIEHDAVFAAWDRDRITAEQTAAAYAADAPRREAQARLDAAREAMRVALLDLAKLGGDTAPMQQMSPYEFKSAQKQLGLSNKEAAHVLRFRQVGSVSDMRRGATPITGQTAELMRAYLAGYRCAGWPIDTNSSAS